MASTSLAKEMNDMKNLLKTFSNEIIKIKRQKATPTRPTFQNYQSGRSSYQQNQFQGGVKMTPQAQPNNQIVPIPTPL